MDQNPGDAETGSKYGRQAGVVNQTTLAAVAGVHITADKNPLVLPAELIRVFASSGLFRSRRAWHTFIQYHQSYFLALFRRESSLPVLNGDK